MKIDSPWRILGASFLRKLYVRGLSITLGLVLLHKVLATAAPFVFRWSMQAFESPGLWSISLAIGAYIAVRTVSSLCGDGKDVFYIPIEQHAISAMARRVFAHVQDLPISFHVQRKTGGLLRLIERGLKGIETFMRYFVFNILPTCLELVFSSAVLAWMYHPIYAVILVVTMVAYALFTLMMAHKTLRPMMALIELDQETRTYALEGLLNIVTIKSFGQEKRERHRYQSFLAKNKALVVRMRLFQSALNVGQVTILSLGLGGLLISAACDVRAGLLQVTDFVVMNGVILQFIMPLHALGFLYREIKQAWIDLRAMGHLMTLEIEQADERHAVPLRLSKGSIVFENVCFGFEPGRLLFQDLSFEVPGGTTAAFVGTTGAGKTTIFSLLMRFLDPQSGRILIDGQDISKVSRASLRQHLGLVAQDTLLFDDTIAYNLRYGRPDASFDEIAQAADKAQLRDLIARLPQRYETLVGERGVRLSGGEKQRMSLARLLVRDPAIFLLDEATSALDVKTEHAIQEQLLETITHKTTLIIAHRLSTVVHAHQIFVLSHGRIAESGTHDALYAHNGLYRRMWEDVDLHMA